MPSNLPQEHVDTAQPRWKTAMADFIDQLRFTHAITLSWNRGVTLNRARADIGDLMHRVDRRLLKSKFHRLSPAERTMAVFAFEGTKHDHVHVHSLWKAPPGKWFNLGQMFPSERGGVWNDVVISGSYAVAACSPNGRSPEIVAYLLKEQHRFSDPDLMVWADEFHRSSK